MKEGKFILQGSLSAAECLMKGWHEKRRRDTLEQTREAENQGWQQCPSSGEVGDSHGAPAQLGAAAVRRSSQAKCSQNLLLPICQGFFFAILSVSCFAPHPRLLVWLSHCLLSLILDHKHSGGGNTSLYSKQAVLLWHYTQN